QAGGDLLPGARRWLASTRGADSWPGAYESARALAARRVGEPQAQGGAGRYAVALNGAELLSGPISDAIATTHSLTLTLDRLQASNTLIVTSSGGAVFAGYQLALAAPPAAPYDGGVGLLREYLDPQTGRTLELSRLRAGQLVRVRLTVVGAELRRFVTIEDALPAGFA